MKPGNPMKAAADELQRAHALVSDGFAPLLPLALAERLRPWAYSAGAILGAYGTAYALPLSANPAGCALGAGALALLWAASRRAYADRLPALDRTSSPQRAAPTRFPAASVSEALRLAGDAHTGATVRLEAHNDA